MGWVLSILALIGLDQGSKFYIFSNRDYFNEIPVIRDFFYLTYLENRGASFSLLQGFRWGFVAMTVVAVAVMIYYFRKNHSTWVRIALTLIISGAIGNFIDRLLRGFVVDFLHFYPFGYNFPVFNIADVCIDVGMAVAVIFLVFFYKEPKPSVEKLNDQEQ
jgi:signal peptidase II